MPDRDWNACYSSGDTPWDTGVPSPHLVELVEGGAFPPCRALEIGCGSGTTSVWLAERGFEVTAIDISPVAIERARSSAGDSCHFAVLDFLSQEVPNAPFELVFDRGCFHSFDDAAVRLHFAERVAALLSPGGNWISLIGSTEGPARDTGPPRRSVRDIASAIEPSLEITLIKAIEFKLSRTPEPRAWMCCSRRRSEPAQPSTGS